jgi:hypothetical protein
MRLFIILIAIEVGPQILSAQGEMTQVLTAALFQEEVHKRVFFKYSGKGDSFQADSSHIGTIAVLIPNLLLSREYPNISEWINGSDAREGYFQTATLIQRQDGKVFLSGNFLDIALELFIDIDSIQISSKRAVLVFHTTSLREREKHKNDYVNVICDLRKSRKGWRPKRVRIKSIQCCSKLW